MGHLTTLCLILALCATAWAQGFSVDTFVSDGQRKKAEKISGDVNEAVKGVNEATGSDITPPEEATGFMRLFFTATPSPSVTPTPSVTPSSSVTPTPSVTPSSSSTPSPTASLTPSGTPLSTPSKSPSSTPFKDRSPLPSPSNVPDSIPGVDTSNFKGNIEGIFEDTDIGTSDIESENPEIVAYADTDANPNIQEGDTAVLSGASAEVPTSAASVRQLSISERFVRPLDYMLSLVERQTTCGVRIFVGGLSIFLVPPFQCSFRPLSIPTYLTGTVTIINGRLAVRFRISVPCVNNGFCRRRVRVRCSVFGTPSTGSSPSPTVSAAPVSP